MTKNQKAQSVIEEVINDIISSKIPLSSIFRKYSMVCQLLGMNDELAVINKELNGYNVVKDIIPDYRKINCSKRYSWNGSLPIFISNNSSTKDQFYKQYYQDYFLYESISKLEVYQGKGLIYNMGEKNISTVTISEILTITPEQINEVLQLITNRLFFDCSHLSNILEFGNDSSNIFSEKEKLVNLLLEKISPESIKKLVTAKNGLKDGEEPIHWSQVALACIDALISFSGDIMQDSFVPKGSEKPKRDNYINKIRYTLKAISQSKERFDYIDKLLKFIHSINDYLQTNKHRSDLVSKEDANRCVIYTYLIISDVLEIMIAELNKK